MTWLVTGSLTVASAADVWVGRLDGDPLAGRFGEIANGRLVIQAEDRRVETPIANVVRIEFDHAGRRSAAGDDGSDATLGFEGQGSATLGSVTLVDGSRLPCRNATLRGAELGFALPGSVAGARAPRLRLPLDAARALRLGIADQPGLREQLDEQWRELADSRPTSDIIAVFRKSTGTLNAVECTVQSLSSERAVVKLDGEPIEAPRERVYGLVFANPASPAASGGRLATVHAAGGLRLAVSSVETRGSLEPVGGGALGAAELRVASPFGFAVRLPIASVDAVDYSASRLVYLSDLPLASFRWRPLFGFPEGQPPERRPAGIAIDRSFSGAPLGVAGEPPRDGRRGLALRSGCEAAFDLPTGPGHPPGLRRFRATAGIDPETAAEGSVVLQVYTDNGLAYEHAVDGSAPVEVDVDVANAARLTLVVDYGGNLDTGDNLHLLDARITR